MIQQHWRVTVGMRNEHQFMPDQTIEVPAPHVMSEDALECLYAYLGLIYDGIYYFCMDYAGAPVRDRGRVEVFITNDKIESIMYEEGYRYLCNHFNKAGLQNRV